MSLQGEDFESGEFICKNSRSQRLTRLLPLVETDFNSQVTSAVRVSGMYTILRRAQMAVLSRVSF